MTDIVTSVPVPSNKISPDITIDVSGLEKSLRRPRTAFNYIMSFLTAAITIIALIPLLSVVLTLVARGGGSG